MIKIFKRMVILNGKRKKDPENVNRSLGKVQRCCQYFLTKKVTYDQNLRVYTIRHFCEVPINVVCI